MVTRKIATKILAKKDVYSIQKSTGLKRLLYKLGSQILIDKKFPLHIYLELSFLCNYSCPMCPRTETSRQNFMSVSLVEKIVNEAKHYGPTSYSLHMFGEPLLHPKWEKIIRKIKSVPGNVVLLTTNGSLMDEECSKKLINLGVDKIFVSVHSLVPGIYFKRTGGNLDRILKNIKVFKKINQQNTKLYVRMFGNDNTDELEGLGIYIEKKPYHNYGGLKNDWTQLKEKERYPCFHPWYTLAVNTEGEVSVCCSDLDCDLFVGSALTQSLGEIWKGNWVKTIREAHKDDDYQFLICRDCDQWQYRSNTFFKCQYR